MSISDTSSALSVSSTALAGVTSMKPPLVEKCCSPLSPRIVIVPGWSAQSRGACPASTPRYPRSAGITSDSISSEKTSFSGVTISVLNFFAMDLERLGNHRQHEIQGGHDQHDHRPEPGLRHDLHHDGRERRRGENDRAEGLLHRPP